MMPSSHRFFTRARARRGLIALAVLAVCWLLVSVAVAYRLTHRKRPPFAEPAPRVAWGALEENRLATDDGQQIGAWFAEGGDGPSVLFLHGNKGSRAHCLQRAGILATEAGCGVLLISLRAHGDSTGDRNDIGYSARRDVVAAVDFLRLRRPGKPVIVFGVSLGSAAATFAAGELGHRVQGYVLESPYQDLKTAVWNRTGASLPPPLDRVAYLGLRLAALAILPELEAISPLRAIDQIPADVAVLILAGGADRLARPEEARALYDRVRSHARLEIFPGANHDDLPSVAPERYRRLILRFCNDVDETSRRLDGPGSPQETSDASESEVAPEENLWSRTECGLIPPKVPVRRVQQSGGEARDRFAALLHDVGAVPKLLPGQFHRGLAVARRVLDDALHDIVRDADDLRAVFVEPGAVERGLNLGGRAFVPAAETQDRKELPGLIDVGEA